MSIFDRRAMDNYNLPNYIDIAVIGAGPQALTLVTHLLQKRAKLRQRIMVFDGSGTWLSQWRHQFARQKILSLRSPAVHHPDPNPYGLRGFAQTRPNELFPPYDLPGTKLFEDFCLEIVRRWGLEKLVYPAKVTQVLPLKDHRRTLFGLVFENGQSIIARRVVLATGAGKPVFPKWVEKINGFYPKDKLSHCDQIDLQTLKIAGEKILIIGGGLSSGHLAVGAVSLGAKVVLMTRRKLQEKLFDADPGWLGPKYLKGFTAELNWDRRWELIQTARNGGSMTPAMMVQLRRASREGKIILQENCEVIQASWQDHRWLLKCHDGQSDQFDRIWLATGTSINADQHLLLKDLLLEYPTKIIKGLPVLDQHLRLPGSECFIMGGLAALQIGPVARNLAGGRMACDRIVPALSKASLAR